MLYTNVVQFFVFFFKLTVSVFPFFENLKIKEPAVSILENFGNQKNCLVSIISNFKTEGSK
jgi:hypothetical protein